MLPTEGEASIAKTTSVNPKVIFFTDHTAAPRISSVMHCDIRNDKNIVAAGIGGVLAAATFFWLAIWSESRFFKETMIVDHLENAALYAPLSPRFAAAFAWLQTVRFEDLAAGRNPIDGTLYAMRNEYATRPQSELPWEAHRAHADIQYMVEGEEHIGFSPLSRMTVTREYDAANDYALYSGPGDLLLLRAGQFAVFYPGDAHAPGIQIGDISTPIKKIVVKVPLF